METVKVLQKVAAQVQAGDVYESGSMQLLPYTGGRISQNFTQIEDESISGLAFKDLPQRGTRKVETSGFSMQFDPISIAPILEAAFGNVTAGVYTLGDNTKKLSVATLDGVNCTQYANAYVKTLQVEGSVDGNIMATIGLVVKDAQNRLATANFPSASGYGDSLVFPEAGGAEGYIRIGTADDALTSADDMDIESFNLSIDNKFDHQFSNKSIGTLTPLFAQGGFCEVGGSFTVSRHSSNQFLDWSDGFTPLQMEIKVYKSATAYALIQVPRFIVKAEITEDDISKINVDMSIGRNGIGSSYKNANMAFVSPIRITLVNS